MDVVEKCISMWHSAVSETEKFSAVQVIVKLIKASDLSHAQKEEIFDSFGFSYLSNLFQNEKVPEGCSPAYSKSVALSVLANFSTVPAVATSDQLCNMVREFKNTLNAQLTSSIEESMVTDTLECICNMSEHDKSRKHLFEYGFVSCLVKMYITDACEKSTLLQIFKAMMFHLPFYIKSECKECGEPYCSAFELYLLKMTKEFHNDSSDIELGTHRSVLTTLCDPLSRIQGDEEWALDFQETITKVLQNRVSEELRELAFKLASLMVDKCGTVWLVDDIRNSKVFFLLLLNNVSLEVERKLRGKSLEDILKHSFLLNACFSICKTVISAMIEDSSMHSVQAFLYRIKNPLMCTCSCIMNFLSRVSVERNSVCDIPELELRELVYVSVQIACIWFVEEPDSLRDEVCKIIPIVLKICNECFLLCKSTETLCSRDTQFPHVDLMQVFLFPLERLISNDGLRATLLENGLSGIIFEYMCYRWSVYQKNPFETDTALCTVCKFVLTLVCMDAKVVHESEEFFSFLKFLLNIVPLLRPNYENLCLKANFSALGLLITKQQYKRIKSCETSFYRFLSFSIKFLWDAHHVEDGNDAISFALVRDYRHVWPEIMEPWFLGMLTLSNLLPVMPWITDFLMESGWPQHIIASLTRVSEKAIDFSIKSAYQAFLNALVSVSTDAAQTLKDCDALYVCKKHKLKQLEALLQSQSVHHVQTVPQGSPQITVTSQSVHPQTVPQDSQEIVVTSSMS